MSSWTAYSQKTVIAFYDSAWVLTTKEFAKYYRVGALDTKKYKYHGKVKDYYINGGLQMEGTFKANIKVDSFYFYYPNGKLMTKGLYQNNLRYGFWTNYYQNGKIKDKIGYYGDFVCALEYYDEDGNPKLINGTGDWKTEFYDDFTMDIVQIEGSYKDTLRHGTWKYYITSILPGTSQEKELKCIEEYENGVFLSGKYFWANMGTEDLSRPTMRILPETTKFDKLEKWAYSKYASREEYPDLKFLPKIDSTVFPVDNLAEFPGGLDSLTKEITKSMKLSKSYIASQKMRSSMFRIMIDTNGKLKITEYLSELKLMLSPDNQLFNDQSIRAIKRLPAWKPASRQGKNVINHFILMIKMDNGDISVELSSMNEKR